MDIIKKEDMSLRKWYGNSVRIPLMNSIGYVAFVSSSIGIVRSILEKQTGKNITVRFVQDGTASADTVSNIIYINQNYLEGRIDKGIPTLGSDDTISLILGIIVHEAAHFAYSAPTLHPYIDHIKEQTKCHFNRSIASTLGNVIEDVFIEAELDRRVPSLTWMLDCTNRVFFSKLDLEGVLLRAEGIDVAPVLLEQVAPVLNVLIYAKTRKEVETTPYIAELFDLVRTAVNPLTLQERLELSLVAYESLMQSIVAIEDEEKESKAGLEESEKKSEGLTAPHEGREVKDSRPGSTVLAGQIERRLRGLKNSHLELIQENNGVLGPSTMVFVEKPLTLGYPLIVDERYSRLAEIGRQRAVVNRPYGMDMNRGNTIRKLYRIATDQKIFAQPITMNNYKPMQVIILVDCSGSMDVKHNEDGTRLKAALRAALGAAVGLVDARCEVAVYGHTADVLGGGTEVMVYRGKAFNEPIDNLSARLGQIEGGEQTSQNRDGYAITYIARKFTAFNKRRLLIVISDGEPAAPGYQGMPAIQHTTDSVKKVRESGIEVLSISITRMADRANNTIYGKKWNVFNDDPNVIEDVIRTLIIN